MDSGMAFTSHWFQCACMEFYDGISIQRQNGSGGGRQALDAPDAKMVLIEELRQIGKTVIAASGLAGFGRSNAMRLRKAGKNLYLAGDLVSGISAALPPASPRAGIAAAIQANTIVALLLGLEI